VFPAGPDAEAITAFDSSIRSRIHRTTPPGQHETEALIRAALGDPDVVIRNIPSLEVFQPQAAVAAAACVKLGLDVG
jgi:hypothetical protein